jgi:broad specificity phosphatase PhoE
MPPGEKPYFGPRNLNLPAAGGLLLVRHSARLPIRNIPESYVVGITEEGRVMAHDFGVQLGRRWKIGAAAASPVGRCMDTCQAMVQGAVNGSRPHPPVQPLNALHFDQKLTGLPGLAGVFLDDPGFTRLVSDPAAPEYALVFQNLVDSLPIAAPPGTINLAVTHDVIITFLQSCLLGLPAASIQDFPGFLEGIYLVRENGQVRLG